MKTFLKTFLLLYSPHKISKCPFDNVWYYIQYNMEKNRGSYRVGSRNKSILQFSRWIEVNYLVKHIFSRKLVQ